MPVGTRANPSRDEDRLYPSQPALSIDEILGVSEMSSSGALSLQSLMVRQWNSEVKFPVFSGDRNHYQSFKDAAARYFNDYQRLFGREMHEILAARLYEQQIPAALRPEFFASEEGLSDEEKEATKQSERIVIFLDKHFATPRILLASAAVQDLKSFEQKSGESLREMAARLERIALTIRANDRQMDMLSGSGRQMCHFFLAALKNSNLKNSLSIELGKEDFGWPQLRQWATNIPLTVGTSTTVDTPAFPAAHQRFQQQRHFNNIRGGQQQGNYGRRNGRPSNQQNQSPRRNETHHRSGDRGQQQGDSSHNNSNQQHGQRGRRQNGAAYAVTGEQPVDLYTLFSVPVSQSSPLFANANVVADSGARDNVVSRAWLTRHHFNPTNVRPLSPPITVSTASTPLTATQKCDLTLTLSTGRGGSYTHTFRDILVLDTDRPLGLLLGRNELTRMRATVDFGRHTCKLHGQHAWVWRVASNGLYFLPIRHRLPPRPNPVTTDGTYASVAATAAQRYNLRSRQLAPPAGAPAPNTQDSPGTSAASPPRDPPQRTAALPPPIPVSNSFHALSAPNDRP